MSAACSPGKHSSSLSAFSLVLLAVWVAGSFPSQARALEWEAGPSVVVRGEFNDNIRLTTAEHDAVWLYTAIPRLKINALDENGELKGDFRFEPLRYAGGGDLDSNNFFADLDGVLKSEFDEWGLGVSYSRDSTIQSELLDTGITNVSKTRKQKSVAPTWRRALSEFMSVELGYYYADVDYEDGVEVGLFDYDINIFSVNASRFLGEFDYLSLSLYYTAFDAPYVGSEYWDRGLKLGFSHVYSDYYRFDATGGVRRTKFNNVISENESSSGFIGEVSVTRRFELSSIRAALERRIDPSGSGLLQQRDSLVLRLTRRFTSMMNGALTLGIYRNKSLERDFTRLDRTYYFVAPGLSWRLAEDWSARVFYRFQYSKYDDASDEAQANVAGLRVSYAWPSPAGGP